MRPTFTTMLLGVVIAFLANPAFSQTINAPTVPSSPYCGSDVIAVDYTVTGSFNLGNTFTAQLSDENGSFASPTNIGSFASATSGTILSTIPTSLTAGGGYRIRVVSNDPASTSADNGADLAVNSGPGNPNDFGDNEWEVYCYDGNNFNTYYGMYTEPSLSFDSRTRWAQNSTPSAASGYLGCTIPNDQHSYRFKRTNFTCGTWQIDIANHDDFAALYVDGVLVWNFNGCCQSHSNVWTGFLGSTSTVEFTIREFGGQSHGGLTFTQINSNPGLTVSSTYDCSTGEHTLVAGGITGATWSPSTFLNTTSGNTVISTPTSPITYTVSGTSTCSGGGPVSATIDVLPSSTTLDPNTDFGPGEWYVFAYDDNNFGNYVGYYSEPNLDFDTRDRWGQNDSPSDATGYVGCTVPDNNHSYRIKRQDFDCGTYQIDVTNHDDHAALYVDGVLVWSINGCCQSHTNVWTGYLGIGSTVELTIREFGGGSHGGLAFTQLTTGPDLTISSTYDCNTASYTLTANGATGVTWSPGTFLNTTSGNSVIATPTSAITYTASATSTCPGGGLISSTVDVAPSHTSVSPATDAGDGEWYVFCYDDNNFGNYQGFYVEPNLTFDSRNRWGQNDSPSDASGYAGCPIPDNNHSYSYKRVNFDCGDYQIDVTGHDDHAALYVDGVLVWSINGCCQTHTNVWTGYLGAGSEVEFTIREFGGGSYGALQFTQLNNNVQVPVTSDFDCLTGEYTLTASGVTGATWSPATFLNTTSGNTVISTPTASVTYTVTGVSGCASSPNATGQVTVAPTPVNLNPDTDFGDGEWYAFVYNGNNFNSYEGLYTEPNLDFDSRNRWLQNGTPSDASGYAGCDIPNDQHSVRFKRTNFVCNTYTINIDGHDDFAALIIDGVTVWSINGCCQSHQNVWTGVLDANSEVEFRFREFGGQSYGAISFDTPGSITTTNWVGTTNDWFSASNWDNGIPIASTNAVIRSGASAYPVINAAGATCYRLTIDNGASLEIAGTNNLDVNESWENQGAFEPGTGSVSFVGGCGPSSISCSSTQAFYDLVINNGNGVQLNTGTFELRGALSLTNGNFATNDALTLVSDISGTARVAEITGGSITGNVTMQRYIPAGTTNWRLLTSPLNGSTLNDWQDDFITSGYPGSPFPNFPFVSIYTYDESISGSNLNNGYVAATSNTQSINAGEGFWVYCGDTSIGTNPFTIDVFGEINQGSISPSLSFTSSGDVSQDGWNLVANPYPSPIDFSNINLTGSLENSYWIYDPQSGNSEVWDEDFGMSNLGLANGNIASSQAFWLHATGTAGVTFEEADKAANAGGIFKVSNSNEYFALRVDDESNNSFYDRLIIRIDDNASVDLDAFDTHKLYSGHVDAPRLASVTDDGFDLAIQSTPLTGIMRSIPVKMESNLTGQFSITAQDLEHFEGSCLLLEDLQNGNIINLMTDSVYYFYQFGNSAMPRFLLHLQAAPTVTLEPLSCAGESDAHIEVLPPSAGNWDMIWSNQQGDTLQMSSGVLTADTLTNIGAGTYVVTLVSNGGLCPMVDVQVEVLDPQPVVAGFMQSADTINLQQGGSITFTDNSSGANSWYWDLGDGTVLGGNLVNHAYLTPGAYQVTQVVDRDGLCLDTATSKVLVVDEVVSTLENQLDDEVQLLQGTDEVALQFNINVNTEANISLYQLNGALVWNTTEYVSAGSRVPVQGDQLAAGQYILSATYGSETKVWKVVLGH